MTEETRMIIEKLDGMQGQLNRVEDKVDRLETKVDGLETKMDGLETKVNGLGIRMNEVESSVRNLKFFVENDIQKKIQIIAEGHLNLNRKLDEVLNANKKQEMYYLKVDVLEKDVRELKLYTGFAF